MHIIILDPDLIEAKRRLCIAVGTEGPDQGDSCPNVKPGKVFLTLDYSRNRVKLPARYVCPVMGAHGLDGKDFAVDLDQEYFVSFHLPAARLFCTEKKRACRRPRSSWNLPR